MRRLIFEYADEIAMFLCIAAILYIVIGGLT